jgi:hypothetical protein
MPPEASSIARFAFSLTAAFKGRNIEIV